MRGNAKHIGVAVLVVATAVAGAPVSTIWQISATPPAVELTADSTALLLSGTAGPKWYHDHVATIMDQFIVPTHPGQTITPVAVTMPNEAWPLTGLFRLIGFAFGDPSIGRPGGEMWPDEPAWKLSGLFDLTGDQSIKAGVADLETAMADHPDQPLVIYGYSQGAVVAAKEKRRLAEKYPWGTDAPDIDFVLAGDVGVPNGGFGARFPGLHIPVLDWTYDGADPTNTQFDTTFITYQYDGFADFPMYPLNVIATLNAVLGLLYVHTWPFDVTLAADPTTAPPIVSQHGDSTFYFFENPHLPLFAPLRSLGVPESLIDVVEPFFRVIVELGYDRSIPPWQPTPARLLPMRFDPARVATDLVAAIKEGINNAAALIGAAPRRIPAAPPLAQVRSAVESPPPVRPVVVNDKLVTSQPTDQLAKADGTVRSVAGNGRTTTLSADSDTHDPTAHPARTRPVRDALTKAGHGVSEVATKVSEGSAQDRHRAHHRSSDGGVSGRR
jgi:PE-PPE domain